MKKISSQEKKKTYVLETSRLMLRRFNFNDGEDFFEILKDAETLKYVNIDVYLSKEQVQDRIDFLQYKYANNISLCFAIELKKIKKVIGFIELSNFSIDRKSANVGYVINRFFWNNGYAKEALDRIIKFGFEEKRLKKILAKCACENVASRKVLEKCKMEFVKDLSKFESIKGKRYQMLLYSILNYNDA